MVVHRCVVYDETGTELFQEEGDTRLVVAGIASERVREEYPSLRGVAWQFSKVYPAREQYVPQATELADWDDFVREFFEKG